jgi:hypothetical protein
MQFCVGNVARDHYLILLILLGHFPLLFQFSVLRGPLVSFQRLGYYWAYFTVSKGGAGSGFLRPTDTSHI